MSHYEELREQENALTLVEQVQEKSLQQIHNEITALNAEIAEAITEVKQSQILKEFAETVRVSGAYGLMGLMTKIPDIIPELAPLFPAIQKLVQAGEKQHELTGKIIEKIEGVNNAV